MMTSRFFKFTFLSYFAAALMTAAAEAQPPGGRGEGGRGQEGRGQRGGGFGQRGGFQFGGQRGGFGSRSARVPGFSELLRSEDVLEELKVDEGQKATIDAAMESYRAESAKLRPSREAFEGLDNDARRELFEKMQKDGEELRAKSDEILTALLEKDQIARLKQIQFQIRVSQSLVAYLKSDEGRKELSITDEQLAKIEDAEEEAQKAGEDARNKMRELFQGGGERPSREAMQEVFAKIREQSTKLREETAKKIEGVLTKDQQAKLASLKGDEFKYDRAAIFGRGGRGGQGGPGGRPQGGFGRGGQGGPGGGRGQGGRGEGGGQRRRPAVEEDDAV